MHGTDQISAADPRTKLAHQTQQLKRNLETPIPAPRIALERKISLRFPHFQGFLTEYSSNVSITGMFIQCRQPRSPGEIVDFEFNLIDGLRLIRGTGEVVWARSTDEDSRRPAGMGIRFLRLDRESRRLIRWAVEKQISAGGETFDLESHRAEAPAAPASPLRTELQEASAATAAGMAAVDDHRRHPYAGYAAARRGAWRTYLPAAATVVLPVAILAAAILVTVPRAESPAVAAGPRPSAPPATPAGQEAAVPPPAPADAGAARPAPATDPASELVAATLAWAEAWASQRPEQYLGHYSLRFTPPRSMSRAAWEAQRAERITRPDFIRVDVSGLRTLLLSADRARVTFDQSYRSDSYRDTMRKTLELVREDGGWKILDERAAG